ncbi:MAG: bifunctional hydroxymethylpyrimidine kinase/phosphomethylpyrimidine kinase [Gemmatimonadetes bacterium]|nr:bifunctional hydroxymethylpyrimidine kinase/phosphomethylpyrimidine kinase [Gemmatimonadota bacterium]
MTEPLDKINNPFPIALTIAGSDSGGGAGIQADLKTFHQYGVYGTSVVVAVTAQNTLGVTAVHEIPVDIVTSQMAALAEDLLPHATKTGMLASPELVEAVASGIRRLEFSKLVVDPVIVATSGDRLLSEEAERSVVEYLVPLATIVTPNLHEAAALAGQSVSTIDDMESAGRTLLDMGTEAVLVTGGHLERSGEIVDVLITETDTRHFVHPRLESSSTHGTGCTLSAAITAELAHGTRLGTAVEHAIDFVHRAIEQAPPIGRGHGPLNHFVAAHVHAVQDSPHGA